MVTSFMQIIIDFLTVLKGFKKSEHTRISHIHKILYIYIAQSINMQIDKFKQFHCGIDLTHLENRAVRGKLFYILNVLLSIQRFSE